MPANDFIFCNKGKVMAEAMFVSVLMNIDRNCDLIGFRKHAPDLTRSCFDNKSEETLLLQGSDQR